MDKINVHIWFPHDSELTDDIIEVSEIELMAFLNCKSINLHEYDDEKSTIYKVIDTRFDYCKNEKRVFIELEYNDK